MYLNCTYIPISWYDLYENIVFKNHEGPPLKITLSEPKKKHLNKIVQIHTNSPQICQNVKYFFQNLFWNQFWKQEFTY